MTFRVLHCALAIAAGVILAPAAMADPAGEQLYNDNCSACHQKTGLGIEGAFPALKGNKVMLGDPKAAAVVVLYGRGGMPAFKDGLSDADLAPIVSYVRGAWGNKAKPIAADVFASARTGPPPGAPGSLQAH
jgi:mono/diheme cytochrome c family protein